jgi:hypothetical protein
MLLQPWARIVHSGLGYGTHNIIDCNTGIWPLCGKCYELHNNMNKWELALHAVDICVISVYGWFRAKLGTNCLLTLDGHKGRLPNLHRQFCCSVCGSIYLARQIKKTDKGSQWASLSLAWSDESSCASSIYLLNAAVFFFKPVQYEVKCFLKFVKSGYEK